MQTSTVQSVEVAAAKATPLTDWSNFLIGLVLTALVPAVFWVAAFAVTAALFGYTPATSSLLVAGMAIAAFLGTFFMILIAKPR